MSFVHIDIVDIFGILAVCFGSFVCAPIIIYYLYTIRQIHDAPILKHRHLASIYTLNGLILCSIVFLELFIAIFTVWNNRIGQMQWILYLINAVFTLPIFIVFALKTYLLYFEQKYQTAIMNMTWLKHINAGVTDWYIAERHSFGNFNYLLKLSFIPYALQILCYILVHVWSDKPLLFHILTISFTSLPLLTACVLFYHVRGFEDLFGIKHEIKYQVLLIFVMLLLYLALFLTFEFVASTETLIRIEWTAYIVFINVLFFSLSILSTAYPVYLNLYGIKDPNDPTGQKRLSLNKSTLRTIYHRGHTKQISTKDSKSAKRSNNTRHLLECIRNEKWFTRFMQHLVYEFSSENMLFLVELIQLKCWYQEENHGVIKVPKSIYHIHHQNSQSVLHSASLGLTIGNYSFSQQSTPFHITPTNEHTLPKVVSNVAVANPALNSQFSICSLSDEDNPFAHIDVDPVSLSPDTSAQSISIKSTPKTPKPLCNTLKIDTDLKDMCTPPAKEDDNDLYQVIDFNAEQAHHGHTSSSFLGNWSPSASYSSLKSMLSTYPDTDFKTNHKQSISVSIGDVQKQLEHDTKHRKSKTQFDLQSMTPTLTIPQARKVGLQRKRSTSTHKRDRLKMFSYLFSTDGKIMHRIRLPHGLPKSKILVNANTLRDGMIALYDKYIGYGSIHELNLSCALRSRMDDIFTSEKAKTGGDSETSDADMYNLLDQVAVSILHLMKDSFKRFQYVPKSKKIPKQNSLEIAVQKPVLRNASSFSEVVSAYCPANCSRKDLKIKDLKISV